MLKKMEQMKKKAESVVNTVDISEREKAAQLRRWVLVLHGVCMNVSRILHELLRVL